MKKPTDKELAEALDRVAYAAWSGVPLKADELNRVMYIICSRIDMSASKENVSG